MCCKEEVMDFILNFKDQIQYLSVICQGFLCFLNLYLYAINVQQIKKDPKRLKQRTTGYIT